MSEAENMTLVDVQGNVLISDDGTIKTEEKSKVHSEALCHRAVSVFLFNQAGALLLQKRAWGKYHSGGLWTNTCCGHPEPGETPLAAANRRLHQEMGITCQLTEVYSFHYFALVGDNIYENEFDHVFAGRYDGAPQPDEREVSDWKWADIDFLRAELVSNPGNYTVWFIKCFNSVIDRASQLGFLKLS